MAKLYPPHIEGALPAFCGNDLIVPFEHSRAVSQDEISKYMYVLKDIQQSTEISKAYVSKAGAIQDSAGNWELHMQGINTSQLSPGTFYKLQLSYVNLNGQEGYFSDVGIVKYIQKPEVKFTGLNQTGLNNHKYHYQIEYKCNDATEKLYSTQFVLTCGNQSNPIASSDVIIHNTNNDSHYEATEDYDFLIELSPKENYWIYAIITTTSGYTMLTPYYSVSAQAGIPTMNGRMIKPVLDFDNGCISIYLYNNSAGSTSLSGRFKLVRADEKENYAIWHSIINSSISATNITANDPYLFWKDFTVEQGYNYIYAIMEVNDLGNYSSKIKSDYIYADFEDAFLFDGDKQLRIRFNPKVSSFKSTVQEVKTDTIGGRYPIIQRNGYTNYKEFPISGLISHLSDPDGYFDRGIANLKYLDSETVVTDTSNSIDGMNYTTNLNGRNVRLERKFKLEVLDWLNNGKPKLFRSPVEGNYLVRLLNTSLSPTDTLGRMLHTFSSTAYEIDEANSEQLVKHGIIQEQYLEGRNNYNLDRNFISYYLNNLQSSNLISRQSELKGKEITGATFSVNPSAQELWVHINNEDVNVAERGNAVYNGTITNLSTPTGSGHSFTPFATDLVTLTYHDALKLDKYNNFIKDIISQNEINQYYGFNYGQTFGDIKIFLQKIHQMTCSVRPETQIIADIANVFQELHLDFSKIYNLAANDIQLLIETLFGGTCIPGFVYKIVNSLNGVEQILGYIDGSTCDWIREGGKIFTGLSKATLTIFNRLSESDNRDIPSVINIVKETILDSSFFSDSTITNIIANPFTCVDIIYKTGINVFDIVTSKITGGSTIVNKDNVVGAVSTVVSNLRSDALNICDNIYNNVNNALQDNGSIPTTLLTNLEVNENSNTVSNIIKGVTTIGTDLAEAAISILNQSNNSTGFTSLIDIDSSLLNKFGSVFNGLFGGMC